MEEESKEFIAIFSCVWQYLRNLGSIFYRWAMAEGYGAKLIKYPEKVRDMVSQVKNRLGHFPCSIKIRIHHDLRWVG